MSATSQPLAVTATASGAITVGALIVIGIIAAVTLTMIDRSRWNPWAQHHGLQRTGTIDPAAWGEPFRPEFTVETPFSGVVRGVPVTLAQYWHALDYGPEGDAKGKLRIQVCVLELAHPLGRLHIRNRTNPGPLRNTPDTGGEPTGHAGFDQRYVITVDDPRTRGHVFGPVLLDFLAVAPDLAAIRVVGHRLVLVGTESRERREHFETLFSLADGIVSRLPADIVRGAGQRAS